jgi:hypothetical protein
VLHNYFAANLNIFFVLWNEKAISVAVIFLHPVKPFPCNIVQDFRWDMACPLFFLTIVWHDEATNESIVGIPHHGKKLDGTCRQLFIHEIVIGVVRQIKLAEFLNGNMPHNVAALWNHGLVKRRTS